MGPDAYNNWAGTIGKFGHGITNDRGGRLLEFASQHGFTISNTLFPHKKSRRVTWHSPGGRTHNQIDFILVPKRLKSSNNMAKTRSYPGADIGSDHEMVLLNFKMKLKKNRDADKTTARFNLEKLKDPHIAEIFENRVGGRYAILNFIDEDINIMTENVSEILIKTADEVLGRERIKRQKWITEDILGMCDIRRSLKIIRYQDRYMGQLYREINKVIRKEITKSKEDWITSQCIEMEKDMRVGNSRKAYKTI